MYSKCYGHYYVKSNNEAYSLPRPLHQNQYQIIIGVQSHTLYTISKQILTVQWSHQRNCSIMSFHQYDRQYHKYYQ